MKTELFDYLIGFQHGPNWTEDRFKEVIIQKLRKCITILENCDELPKDIFLLSGGEQIGIMTKGGK